MRRDEAGERFDMLQQILDLRSKVERMREACIQARGALRLDVMLDDDGKPFGTTTVALEHLDAVLEPREPSP